MSKTFKIQDNDISDGYHTFGELYDHRCALFVALCRAYERRACWRRDAKTPGWICLYLELPAGQVSYHIPERMLEFIPSTVLETPHHKWDGHTSADVLKRLLE